MNKVVSFVLFAFLLLSFTSCGGQKMPDGMPPLHPTNITVTQAGQPLEGAVVNLVNADDPNYRWVIGGRTDARGICQVRTQGEFVGAPEGRFKVLIRKQINEGGNQPATPDPLGTSSTTEARTFDLVNLKYSRVDTTDLEIEISRGSNAEEFDVGEAVRVEFVPFGR